MRKFFDDRGFVEVETPVLADEIIPELHIEPVRTEDGQFLQASPELYMKRLMAAGATAIYQVTRSFRSGERGRLHNPEFTIVEWYRAGDDMRAGMDLLDDLAQTMFGAPPALRTSYADAFSGILQINPHKATVDDLAAATEKAAIIVTEGMQRGDRDEWLNLLLATQIEPQLGRDRPEILYHYPASQASLATVTSAQEGYEIAERFELYYRGIELANGFHELGDATELRRRFEAVNAARRSDGRNELPLPERLLETITDGLPPCTGVALGFDRLAMLAIGAATIRDVMTIEAGANAV